MKKAMKSISIKIALAVFFAVMCFLTVFFAIYNPAETAYAVSYNDSTYANFIRYSGSLHNFGAEVTYPSSVTSQTDVDYFSIRCNSTEIEWSIFGPTFNNVKITMTRPDNSTKVYSFNNGIRKDHFNITIFNSNDLYNDNGKVIEGEYKVQASGALCVDLQKDQQQTSSFTFYVNLNAPTVTLKAGGVEFAGGDTNPTKENVTVTASDTDGSTPTLLYGHSTTDDTPTATTSFTSGKVFSDKGYYCVKATDIFGKSTTKYFTIDKTAPTLTLSGVTNGGFTNGNVSASWTSGRGDIDAQKVNLYDVITVKYSYSTSSSFPASAETAYSSGKSLSSEGNYLMTITDKAGNSTSYKFTIDKTAPTLTLSGVTNGGFTNGKVSASWSTTVGGVGAQRTNSDDALTVKYSRGTGSSFPTSATTTYTSGTSLTEEGNYLMTITDKAGNATNYKFTIDKTAPTLTLSGASNGGFTKNNVSMTWSTTVGGAGTQLTNSNDALTVKYLFSTTSSFPETATIMYSSGNVLINEGNYLVTITDKTGNSTSYTFTIDKTAPTLTLSGVADGGFTNGTVKASWATDIGGAGAPLTNNKDAITVKYSYSTSASFPASATTVCNNGVSFTDEGNYLLTITDKSGNTISYTFTIDKQAPTLTLQGVTDGGFTNGNITAAWGTDIGGVGAQLINNEDILTVKYSLSKTSVFPGTAETSYSAGGVLSEEGNYLIVITDRAGNSTSYTFTIDKTAPTLTFTGFVVEQMAKDSVYASWITEPEGAGKTLTNANDTLTVRYSMQTDVYPSAAQTDYKRNSALSAEGYYIITITDKTGNVTSYLFLIDKTAPVVAEYDEYTNKTFTFSASDPRDITIEYRLDGGAVQTVAQTSVEIICEESNYGSWEFRAIDAVGNATSWATINLYLRDTFGNKDEIKNSYKVPTWYTVRLPAKVFPDIEGTYSFETYENALNFAIAKEWQYRVVELSGDRWSYINISNESVSQIYDDRAALDKAVLKYASGYVSDRKVFDVAGSKYPNPTDGTGETRPDALTSQNLVLPEHLSQYAGLPLYFIGHAYRFIAPIQGVNGNTTSVFVQFISDGLNPQGGAEIAIPYGQDFKTVMDAAGAWKQGYYLVTERDLCGNVEKYIICLDTELPTMTANVQFGDGSSENIGFNQEYVTANEDVMLYVSMDMQSFADNLDEYVMIMLEGRALDRVLYVGTDELPVLCYENGFWGTYTITLYDRSLNALSFSVKIAGQAPSMKHSSLSNETRCTITIVNNDTGNALTNVELFKVAYTGEYVQLFEDGDGTPISPETLSYVLRTGGKYVLRFTDIFGRVIETEPIFYMKGLPVGALEGVKDGGITNKDVSLEYSSENAVVLYVWEDGKWVETSDVMKITEKEGYEIAEVSASELNSRLYKFFLYKEEDMNLFVEYRFEIDCIAPTVEVAAEDGSPIDKETVTQKNFKATWDENGVTVYYYRADDPLGDLSEIKYTKETIITKAGTYVFTAYDEVGNVTKFSITLDNLVSYTLTGDYSILSDGSYISKNSITLTVTERTSRFECQSSNGIEVKNGTVLDIDGTYKFTIEDVYGNKLEITVIIDNLPPTPIIRTTDGETVAIGGTTNKPFTVSCDEAGVTIVVSVSTSRYESYDGAALGEEKTYTFKMTDRMNNIATFTVTVDLHVDYTLRGNYIETGENSYLSRGGLTLNVNETFSGFDVQSINGNRFSVGDRITAEDTYTVTIKDIVGNVVVLTIIIDQTPPTPEILTEGDEPVSLNGKTNKPFTVRCSEDGAVIQWSMKNGGYVAYKGEECSDIGVYYFKISDVIGNELYFTVEIDRGVDFTVSGNYVKDGAERYVSRSGITVTVNEEYRRFDVQSDTELTFAPGEKVTREGEYIVTIEDLGGNIAVITLVIDQTPPIPIIQDSEGQDVAMNSVVNKGVIVSCAEERVVIEYSMNDREYLPYSGALVEEAGTIYFKVTDIAGNATRFNVTIDRGVDYTITGTYVVDYLGRYVSRSGLTVKVKEEYRRFDVQSNTGHTFVPDEKVTREGEYTVTIEDLGGNAVTFTIVIDFTPPEPYIRTVSGREISPDATINEGFIVSTAERGATIQISTNGMRYEVYDGSAKNAEGIYYLIVSDLVGNSSSFTVTVDKTVDYKLKGTYQTYDGKFYTRYGVTLEVNEPMAAFEVTSDAGNTVTVGEKITKEDTYTVTIEDEVGNRITLIIIVDYQPPVIELEGVNDENVTKGDVVIRISDFEKAECRMTGSDKVISVSEISTVSENGYYTVRAYDRAGNEASVSFRIDKVVEVTPSVSLLPDQYITGDIFFKFEEDMSEIVLQKDGTALGYSGGVIRETGKYVLTVTDNVGNVGEWRWEILPAAARNYLFDIPEGYAVTATLDGAAIDVIKDGSVSLEKDGLYSLSFSKGGQTFSLELRVDTVAPTVQIEKGKDKVVISSPNKENLTLTLYCNGKEMQCAFGQEITATGDYTLIVTDELGNTTQYSFELHYINPFGIVVIVIGGLVVLAGVIVIIVARKKQGVK